MAIKEDPHGRGHSIGNLDDEKRGRKLGGKQHDGVKGTNPVTTEQVKNRRGLAKQDPPKRGKK